MDATNAVSIVVALTAIISVIVSLITAASSASQKSFDNLEKYVERLEKRLKLEEDRGERLERELEKYKRAFARAVLFIRTNMPGKEIPNFMIDTGDVTGKKDGRRADTSGRVNYE